MDYNLNTKIALNKVIYIFQYDADFGSVNPNQSAGSNDFEMTFSETQMKLIKPYRELGYTISARVVSAQGAYGNGYSFNVTEHTLNSGGNTLKITSNAMNLSDESHTLIIRFLIAIFAE